MINSQCVLVDLGLLGALGHFAHLREIVPIIFMFFTTMDFFMRLVLIANMEEIAKFCLCLLGLPHDEISAFRYAPIFDSRRADILSLGSFVVGRPSRGSHVRR